VSLHEHGAVLVDGFGFVQVDYRGRVGGRVDVASRARCCSCQSPWSRPGRLKKEKREEKCVEWFDL